MLKYIFSGVFVFFTGAISIAQTTKNIQHLDETWLAYFNQVRLSEKWGTWTDFQLRTKDRFVNNLSVGIVRVGVTYYVSNSIKLTAGFAWANYFPQDNHKHVSQPELRPWQQVQWDARYGRKRMVHWVRLEERYRNKILNDSTLADGYNFNYRLRYNWRYELPLDKKGSKQGAVSLIINDEINVNAGKQIVYNYFDQNRFYTGLKIQTSAVSNIQFGYLNIWQQLAAGNQYKSVNAIRLSYYQSFDLRHIK
ncbi:DUF2490 domain-containing protein [Ferruginibacter sp.]|uniref:DUF2490 domain-containing protein n=1 Tax=Ferruginibacter sp. TaxID=1940288 RepID=UPI00198D6EEE|nr:DUF2490 domain-containing protein [Ferruginibacter sp.]MBC7628057.1 DUF2490 domain-containing protein [Ferruginibacter sp.]